MKKNILYIVPLMLLPLFFSACSSDEIESESVITVDNYRKNAFDRWLEENFRNPYNIDFKYRYEEIESDYDYYTVPADIEQSIKMAVIVVSTVPIMCVYPFLQKYFVKGVMVGALKG